MATTLRILSWNIRDAGKDQINDPDFINLVVKVITTGKFNFISVLETKSNLGAAFGAALVAKLGAKKWDCNASPQSAPASNKPENYLFVWSKTVVRFVEAFIPDDLKDATKYGRLGFPHKHNNNKSKSPSRFPYVGKFEVDPTGAKHPLTVVAFHTCFTGAWICESNQKLAKIDDVRTGTNVIVMGDFNDHPNDNKTYKGKPSFGKLMGKYQCVKQLDHKTSLADVFLSGWTQTTDTLASMYDNFFVKLAAPHNVVSAGIVDLIDALIHGNYLEKDGKRVFNTYVARKNIEYAAKGKTLIDAFGASDHIADIEDAHEVYREAISDHIPIKMEVQFR